MLITLILSSVASLVLLIAMPDKVWYSVPIGVILVIIILSEIFSDRLYNPIERKKEIKKQDESYRTYIETVKKILEQNGIDNRDKLLLIKEECEKNLSQHNNTYNNIIGKIYNVLIGVPIGALIALIIYGDNAAVESIVALILFGIMLILVAAALKKLMFYANGYFKDKCLLEALKELEYSDF